MRALWVVQVDANGDGELSARELQSHLQGTGYSPRTVSAIFDSLDLNQDGTISRDELRQSFAKYDFSALRYALRM